MFSTKDKQIDSPFVLLMMSIVLIPAVLYLANEIIQMLVPGKMYDMSIQEVTIRAMTGTFLGFGALFVSVRLAFLTVRAFWREMHPHQGYWTLHH